MPSVTTRRPAAPGDRLRGAGPDRHRAAPGAATGAASAHPRASLGGVLREFVAAASFATLFAALPSPAATLLAQAPAPPPAGESGGSPLARLFAEALADAERSGIPLETIALRIELPDRSRLDEWPRDQLHRWYCAPSGALNLNDNCIDVVIAPSGGRIEVSLRPQNALYSLENAISATRERARHLYAVDRAVDSWKIRVSGRFLATAPARTEWITTPDPALSFLGAWRALLAAEGIEVAGELRIGKRHAAAVRVARIEHRLEETLPVLLKNSQNLYGDCLLRVANRVKGGDGSFAGAGATALAFLAERGGGEGAAVRDGSGLSPRNRLSCADLVLLLEHAERAPWRARFWEALPLAGVDGTLEKRFRGSALAGRLRGKTGHLAGVTGLAGGWEAKGGAVRFAALTGGRGAKVGPFRDWLDALLIRVDAALAGAATSAPPPAQAAGL